MQIGILECSNVFYFNLFFMVLELTRYDFCSRTNYRICLIFSLSFLHPWQHLRANHKYSCSDFPYYHTLQRAGFASLLLTSLACSTNGPNGSDGQRDTPLAWRTATHRGALFASSCLHNPSTSTGARAQPAVKNKRKTCERILEF